MGRAFWFGEIDLHTGHWCADQHILRYHEAEIKLGNYFLKDKETEAKGRATLSVEHRVQCISEGPTGKIETVQCLKHRELNAGNWTHGWWRSSKANRDLGGDPRLPTAKSHRITRLQRKRRRKQTCWSPGFTLLATAGSPLVCPMLMDYSLAFCLRQAGKKEISDFCLPPTLQHFQGGSKVVRVICHSLSGDLWLKYFDGLITIMVTLPHTIWILSLPSCQTR